MGRSIFDVQICCRYILRRVCRCVPERPKMLAQLSWHICCPTVTATVLKPSLRIFVCIFGMTRRPCAAERHVRPRRGAPITLFRRNDWLPLSDIPISIPFSFCLPESVHVPIGILKYPRHGYDLIYYDRKDEIFLRLPNHVMAMGPKRPNVNQTLTPWGEGWSHFSS